MHHNNPPLLWLLIFEISATPLCGTTAVSYMPSTGNPHDWARDRQLHRMAALCRVWLIRWLPCPRRTLPAGFIWWETLTGDLRSSLHRLLAINKTTARWIVADGCWWWFSHVDETCWWLLMVWMRVVDDGCSKTPRCWYCFLFCFHCWAEQRHGLARPRRISLSGPPVFVYAQPIISWVQSSCHVTLRIDLYNATALRCLDSYHIHICLGVQLGLLMDIYI